MEACLAHKQKGNEQFKGKQYKPALELYASAVDSAPSELSDTDKKEVSKIHSNAAQCHLFLGDFRGAIRSSEQALRLHPSNGKALFRCAKANEALDNIKQSRELFSRLMKLEPSNGDALKAYMRVSQKMQHVSQRANSHIGAWERLTANPDALSDDTATAINDIRICMRDFLDAKDHQLALCEAKFPSTILSWAVDDRTPFQVRVECTKAVRSMVAALSKSKLESEKSILFGTRVEEILSLIANGKHVLNVCLEEAGDESKKATASAELMEELVLAAAQIGLEVERLLARVCRALVEALQWEAGEARLQTALAVCKGISLIALNQEGARTVARSQFLQPLLFSPLAGMESFEAKEAVVRSLVGLSGTRMVGSKDNEVEEKTAEADTEFRSNAVQMIQKELLTPDASRIARGLRACSLLLQSIPDAAFNLMEQSSVLQKVVDVANGEECPDDDGQCKLLAAEVLALGSSSTAIRKAIVDSDNYGIFLGLMTAKDPTVRMHAALALSKLAAVQKDLRKEVIGKSHSVLAAVIGVLQQGQDAESHTSSHAVSLAMESLAYLSLHGATKKKLASHDKGTWFKCMAAYSQASNRALRHGVLQILHNMVVSVEDKKQEYDSELEKLKRVAQKGLPEQNREKDIISDQAGSEDLIKIVRRLLVKRGGVKAVSDCIYMHHRQPSDIKLAKPVSDTIKPFGDQGDVDERLLHTIANTLLLLSNDEENRGFMVQQGALRLLVDLHRSKHEKTLLDTSLAIARVSITTNPNLYPDMVLPSLVRPLLWLIKHAEHELFQYEGLLALTNLASTGESMRERVVQEGAWADLRLVLTSENDRIQTAALECMCNLVMCDAMFERLSKPTAAQDLKLFALFCGAEDVAAKRAASGALAMLSHSQEVAKLIKAQGGVEAMDKLSSSCRHPEIQARVKAFQDNCRKFNL